jgi:nucleotide-binding universal stress UspA family protein
MAESGIRQIVVGVDGSEESITAARWAVDEARLRDRPVQLIHAYNWPVPMVPMAPPPANWTEESLRQAAEALVNDALGKVRTDGVQVSGGVRAGPAPYILIDTSRQAELLVVGHRGRGGFAKLLLGSVAASVAAHAECPVAVVRPYTGQPRPSGPVLVGADGSAASGKAVEFAFAEADRRGVPLAVLRAWRPPMEYPPVQLREGELGEGGPRPPGQPDPASVEAAEAQRLQDWVRPWQEKHPGVDVRWLLSVDRPAAALVEAAGEAALVVVGSRGHGGFTGLLLGSVSQQLINHAPCPVVVVR